MGIREREREGWVVVAVFFGLHRKQWGQAKLASLETVIICANTRSLSSYYSLFLSLISQSERERKGVNEVKEKSEKMTQI